jgi:hypothetical protein
MSVIRNALLLATDEVTGYNLTKSLRFRSSSSAYLNRTPASASNRQIFTYSVWLKRGSLGSRMAILDAYASSAGHVLEFQTDDTLDFYAWGGASALELKTTQVFRDPSAWYHIILAVDTTQATASNRIKMYVNGIQVTAFGTATYPSQNASLYIDNNILHDIGRRGDNQFYYDGYIAEINFIDGQQLTTSSFGENNATTGVWQPKRYTGTYGTNGFYLPFTDVATTSGSNAGLGKDFSGNGNYWTTNNISVTSGSTYDSMSDVPTLTSATAANYCTWNPLDTDTDITLSAGNLNASQTANNGICKATIGVSSGKWYWEVTPTSASVMVGIAQTTTPSSSDYVGSATTSYGYFSSTGVKYNNSSAVSYGATYTTGDVIGVALDMDAGTVVFYKNNTSQGTAFSSLSGTFTPAIGNNQTNTCVANFGQRAFTYTPPTGFVALNTYNLPDSTIVAGNKVMDATTYTGNGSTRTITNSGAIKPDFVWLKSRVSSTWNHQLYDSLRAPLNSLSSNTSDSTYTYTDTLTAFNSNGFSLGTDATWNGPVNKNGDTYVAWQWQAGQGTTSSNTSGSITSTVSVNASAGFSVVTFTTDGTTKTVGHGLGVAPKLIIVKCRNNVRDWYVYTSAVDGTWDFASLNTTAAFSNSSYSAPTSSVFTISDNNGYTQVAYCWAEIAGFSQFGSYTGNGSTDGPFIYCGFRPKYLLIKGTAAGTDWFIIDTTRATYNVASPTLLAESSGAEFDGSYLDILSNGFKLKSTSIYINSSGGTFVYAAFAENPFKNALAR